MKAEIIAVGTEILLGDIVNTNSQYLAKRLADLGISVYHQTVVGDNEIRLYGAFESAFSHADMVITTGGLGPTKDDLTKEVGAKYFNRKLYLHEESLNKISDYFLKRNLTMNDGNKKQAFIPKDAIILENDNGTAPGCIIEDEDKILVMLPGPPSEMQPMFEKCVFDYLKKFSQSILLSKVLHICGIGEGHMAEKIGGIIDQVNPTVAPYAKEGEVILRITAKADNEEAAMQLIRPTEAKLREILGEDIYGEGEDTLEGVVGELMIGKNLTVSTAESCTGGLLAGRLINYPGISSAFLDGVVAYSNDSKIKRLGVRPDTLNNFGAVSSETAAEMALGIARSAGTNIGIATTGIAGPSGGSEEKPVGLVYVGLSINNIVKTKELRYTGSRQKIRERTVIAALDWLRREIQKI